MGCIDKFPLASYGRKYVVGAAVLAGSATALDQNWLAIPLWVLTAYIAYFFRDPARTSQGGPNIVLSPADGKVVAVEQVDEPRMPMGKAQLISIFMNLFDVHVNRIPIDGVVREMTYHPGGFVPANRKAATSGNERQDVMIETPSQKSIIVTQVAGLVARRIECRLDVGQEVKQIKRYGMIRFGSRLDVYLPMDATIVVACGDRVKAGVSPIGEL